MGAWLYANRTARNQVQVPAKTASQRKPSPVDPIRIPLWATLAYGNQVPPSLRLPVVQPPQVESSSPTENYTGERLQRVSQTASQEEETRQEGTEPRQHKENTTGLPETLKVGIESLSGLSLDDVQVHYHSSKPIEVQALAYTQGTEIHVGPGQEKHLAHEAWHIVQQKQGRVKPTLQAKEIAINDDQELEQEADAMGKKALRIEEVTKKTTQENQRNAVLKNFVHTPIQRYEITAITADGSQHVVFRTDEKRPDEDGNFMRDGYSYEQVGNFEYVRRKKIIEFGAEIDNPAYESIRSILNENPLMPVREFEVAAWEVGISDYNDDGDLISLQVTDEQRAAAIEYIIESHYSPVVRFAKQTDLKPKVPMSNKWKEYFNPEELTTVVKQEIWDAAFKHMDSKEKENSPFISVTEDEGALLGSTDFEVGSIIFGTPDAEKQAPLIVHLLVPEVTKVRPEAMETYIKAKSGKVEPLLLQKREKEALILTDDLAKYVVGTRPNPYTSTKRGRFNPEFKNVK